MERKARSIKAVSIILILILVVLFLCIKISSCNIDEILYGTSNFAEHRPTEPPVYYTFTCEKCGTEKQLNVGSNGYPNTIICKECESKHKYFQDKGGIRYVIEIPETHDEFKCYGCGKAIAEDAVDENGHFYCTNSKCKYEYTTKYCSCCRREFLIPTELEQSVTCYHCGTRYNLVHDSTGYSTYDRAHVIIEHVQEPENNDE